MYTILFGDKFLNSAKKLGKSIVIKLNFQLSLLQQDPFHAKLHTKPLHGKLAGFYSFRIGRDYRIIFKFLGNQTILLVIVSHRREVYR